MRSRDGLWTLAGVAGVYAAYRAARAITRRSGFSGRVVVVTGASRGLGLVLARQLADEGAQLAICSRHADQLERATRELEARGARVFAQPCDLTHMDELLSFFAGVRRNLG